MLIGKRNVSTLVFIILLLCSVVFGAIISYLLVMANYYNMPENTTILMVENVVFPDSPVLNVSYFDVTILNPSNSVSDVNMTAIQLTIEGKNDVYTIAVTEPELPFLIKRGTRQTFKCLENWSEFAGKNVRIEPVAANISTKSCLYSAPNIKLNLQPKFDETVSVEYFNLTVENLGTLNLTLSDITVKGESISDNVTPPLTPPIVLSLGQSETFKCDWSWDWRKVGIQNFTITVKTVEGYEKTYITSALLGAILSIEDIKFDYSADTAYFNLTVRNSQESNATVTLDKVNLTLTDGTTITLSTEPPLYLPLNVKIPPNQSLTIKCIWNWTEYRNETITVDLYTKQGFMVPSMNATTPSAIVWNITDLEFNLDYTHYFLVDVTNMPCSLGSITVTKIMLNGNETTMEPSSATLANGEQKVFNCSISWKKFIGETVNVTVLTAEGLSISRTLVIPSVKIELLGDAPVFGDLQDPNINITIPYINVTVSNSVNSLQSVTITKIVIEGNGICEVDGSLSHPKLVPEGHILKVGETVTIICPWNYGIYLPTQGKLTVTLYTAEGFQTSKTWYVP